MTTSLFRRAAVESVSSPDQLNTLIRITDSRGWVLLSAAILLLLIGILWAFLGSWPITVSGQGILVQHDGAFLTVTSTTAGGHVDRFMVGLGDRVVRGQVVAVVRRPAAEFEIKMRRKVVEALTALRKEWTVSFFERLGAVFSSPASQAQTRRLSLYGKINAANDRIAAVNREIDRRVPQRGTVLSFGPSELPDDEALAGRAAAPAPLPARAPAPAPPAPAPTTAAPPATNAPVPGGGGSAPGAAGLLSGVLPTAQPPGAVQEPLQAYIDQTTRQTTARALSPGADGAPPGPAAARPAAPPPAPPPTRRPAQRNQRSGADGEVKEPGDMTFPELMDELREQAIEIKVAREAMTVIDQTVQIGGGSYDSLRAMLGAAVLDLEAEISRLEVELRFSEHVRATANGRVTELVASIGEELSLGDPIVRLQTGSSRLGALIYVPADLGQRIEAGMAAQIALNTAPREQFGVLLAEVRQISPLPVTREKMEADLENDFLVAQFSRLGSSLRTNIDLVADETSANRYRWSSSRGEAVKVENGMLVSATITIRDTAPAATLLPILAGWLL